MSSHLGWASVQTCGLAIEHTCIYPIKLMTIAPKDTKKDMRTHTQMIECKIKNATLIITIPNEKLSEIGNTFAIHLLFLLS